MSKTQIITLTPKAALKAKQLLESKQSYVRFGLKKGGCSGFMYDIGMAKEVGEEDILVEQDDSKVLVSSSAKEFLLGSTIDYNDSLLGAGFKIHNPNVKKACKCGHSVR